MKSSYSQVGWALTQQPELMSVIRCICNSGAFARHSQMRKQTCETELEYREIFYTFVTSSIPVINKLLTQKQHF